MNKTPEEVLKAISADFRFRKITQAQAAKMLGYSNVQSVANVLSVGNRNVKYLSPIQASRYSKTFGYSEKFLTSGEGTLIGEEDYYRDQTNEGSDSLYEDDNMVWEKKYRDLVAFVMKLLPYTHNKIVGPLFDAYLRGDEELVREVMLLLDKKESMPCPGFSMRNPNISKEIRQQQVKEYNQVSRNLLKLLDIKGPFLFDVAHKEDKDTGVLQ